MGNQHMMGARQVYQALRDQILSGVFGTDGVLPSSRALAVELGISRSTVTVAYEQLAAEGYVEVRQGARPRVAARIVEQGHTTRPAPMEDACVRLSAYGDRISGIPVWTDYLPGRHLVDFRYGDLTPSDFPVQVWRKAMAASLSHRPDRLAYGDPRGSERLRKALQGYLWRARSLSCGLEQIIVVNGSQQGLDLCARLLLDPGDAFVIEDPCYAMARQVFAGTGAEPRPISVDGEGLRTDLLAGIEAQLAYVTPSHQFPLGSVLPIGRRHQLLEWARQMSGWIIEDDYDSEYRYDISPVPPLHRLDEAGRTIYLGTVSKTLSPTLRLGYLVVPPALQTVFAAAKQLTDRHSPVAEQEALATLIESGTYEAHVRKVRRLNGDRRRVLLKTLVERFGDRICIEGADAGLHVVVWFRDIPQSQEPCLVKTAGAQGLGLHTITRHYASAQREVRPDMAGLVMGYSALDPRQITRGVALLEKTLQAWRVGP